MSPETGPHFRETCTKARRDLSDSLLALYLLVFTHVFVSKPVLTFGRHALKDRDHLCGKVVKPVAWQAGDVEAAVADNVDAVFLAQFHDLRLC